MFVRAIRVEGEFRSSSVAVAVAFTSVFEFDDPRSRSWSMPISKHEPDEEHGVSVVEIIS